MGPGESFGELALMYSTPRTATCKAIGKARLWALDRISFKVGGCGREGRVLVPRRLTTTQHSDQCVSTRWPLFRAVWQVILQATTTARRTQHKSFLESVPTLEQLTEYEILTIADALVEDSYEDGDVICTQGEVGDAFYIIKKVQIPLSLLKNSFFAAKGSILLPTVGNGTSSTSSLVVITTERA